MHNPVTSVSFPYPTFVEYRLQDGEVRKLSSGRVRVFNITQAQELKRAFTEQGYTADVVYRLRYSLNTYYFTLEELKELETMANDIISADWSYESDRPSFKAIPKKIVD